MASSPNQPIVIPEEEEIIIMDDDSEENIEIIEHGESPASVAAILTLVPCRLRSLENCSPAALDILYCIIHLEKVDRSQGNLCL